MKFLLRWMLNFLISSGAVILLYGISVVFGVLMYEIKSMYGAIIAMWASIGIICFVVSFVITFYFWKNKR